MVQVALIGGSGVDAPVTLVHPVRPDLPRQLESQIMAESAFADTLVGLTPGLRGVARRLACDPARAEDLVQETMLKAWRARQSFTPGTNMRAWASRILRNTHLSSLRRLRWEGDWTEELECSLGDEERQTWTVELKQIAALMERLSSNQRIALELVAVEQLSYEDAAERVGVALGTMKSRVTRARAALIRMSDSGSLPSPASLAMCGDDPPDGTPDMADCDAAAPPRCSFSLAQWRAAKAARQSFLIGGR